MKLSKRDLGLLLILLGLAIALVCYFAIFSPTQEKNEVLRGEIATLQPILAELKAKEAKVPAYRAGIEEAKETIQRIKSGYPTDVRQEDLIMYAVSLEDVIGLDTAGMSFSPPTVISEFEPIVENNEVVFDGVSAYKTGATIDANLTYRHMKDLVGYVYERSIKTTLDSVSISYNAENGILLGVLGVSKYYIASDSDPYIETYVPPMPTGQTNPFGSLTEMTAVPGAGGGDTAGDDGEG